MMLLGSSMQVLADRPITVILSNEAASVVLSISMVVFINNYNLEMNAKIEDMGKNLMGTAKFQ